MKEKIIQKFVPDNGKTLQENIDAAIECIDLLLKNANVKRQLGLLALKYVLTENDIVESEIYISGLDCFISTDILFSSANVELLNCVGFKVYVLEDFEYESRMEFDSYMIVAPGGKIPKLEERDTDFYNVWKELGSD